MMTDYQTEQQILDLMQSDNEEERNNGLLRLDKQGERAVKGLMHWLEDDRYTITVVQALGFLFMRTQSPVVQRAIKEAGQCPEPARRAVIAATMRMLTDSIRARHVSAWDLRVRH